jgi:hypothetical protein
MQQTSLVRRGRKEKLAAMAARLAISIATKKGDPAIKKYKTFRDKFIEMKKRIFVRYRPMAIKAAREAMKRNMRAEGTKAPTTSKKPTNSKQHSKLTSSGL